MVRGVTTKVGLGRCGFAAFYALSFRFNPKTPSRALQFLFQVINPPHLKDVRHIPKAVEDWEAQRSMLRDEFDERLSDRMASAILTSMMPQEFKDLVFQHQGSQPVVHEEVKGKILAAAQNRIVQAAPTPMDIGEVTGEAKDEKEEVAYDEINQLGKGGGKGTCYRCGGKGHMANQCATPAPDYKGFKGAGKGDKEE